MKRLGEVACLALTWDGARWPIRSLLPKAREFLGANAAPSAQMMAALLKDDRVKEIRICWVPSLKGGDDVLAVPFSTDARIAFKVAKVVHFGDTLGVIYKR